VAEFYVVQVTRCQQMGFDMFAKPKASGLGSQPILEQWEFDIFARRKMSGLGSQPSLKCIDLADN
jgi:hypothetical protein